MGRNAPTHPLNHLFFGNTFENTVFCNEPDRFFRLLKDETSYAKIVFKEVVSSPT